MAKKKASEESASEAEAAKAYQPRIDPELAKDINIICSLLEIGMGEYINNRLAPIVAKELPEVLASRGFHRKND